MAIKKLVYANGFTRAVLKKYKWRKGSKARKGISESGLKTAQEVLDALVASGQRMPTVSFGTLLGVVRDQALMPHDTDMDFAIVVADASDWIAAEDALSVSGYRKIREYSHDGVVTEQAYQAEGFTFDLFGFFPDEDGSRYAAYFYCLVDDEVYSSSNELSVKRIFLPYYDSTTYEEVEGVKIAVPSNASAILETVYGATWMVPDSDWVSGSGWTLLKGVTGVCNY